MLWYLTSNVPNEINRYTMIIVVLDQREQVRPHWLKYHTNMRPMRTYMLEMIQKADHMVRSIARSTTRLEK